MSEQTDAVNAVLRERGVLPPAVAVAEQPDGKKAEENFPRIMLPGKNRTVNNFFREVGAVLCTNGVFLRDQVPVVLNKKRMRIEEMSSKALRSYVDNHAILYRRVTADDGEAKECRMSMKKEDASDMLASYDFLDQQRQIRRVNSVPLPVLRANGLLELLKPGYDYDSQILTMPTAMSYDVMPVEEAVQWIVNRFKDFMFDGKDPKTGLSPSLAVHVAAMLTPFCFGLLPHRAIMPMFIYTGNKPGTGKSLLCKSSLYAVFGEAAALPFGKDEEELRKQLEMTALANTPYLFFDNVKRKIASSLIDAWQTQPSWKGRYMGGQKEFVVEKQNVIYISSNHAEVDKDSNRRALFVELFLEDADINERSFDQVLDDDFLSRDSVRREMLSVLWSLVVHWDKSGRPAGPRSLASFEQWARVIGGIVSCAVFGDPLQPRVITAGGDTETKDMRDLVSTLAQDLIEEREAAIEEGKEPPREADFKFERVIEICQDKDLFIARLDGKEVDGAFVLTRSSRIQIGKLLQRESGQVWQIEGLGRVRFGRKGSKNWRSFAVELI
ncbi:MAG: hypothetical protein WCS65_16115 [Verrucomicrobiae bacterium]